MNVLSTSLALNFPSSAFIAALQAADCTKNPNCRELNSDSAESHSHSFRCLPPNPEWPMHETTFDRRTFLSGSAALLFCASAGAQSAGQAAPLKTYGFEKALWFDGAGFRLGAFYFVSGTLTFDRPASVDVTIDLSGQYVVPPFAEAHNHNIEPRPGLAEAIRRYLTEGIFYVKVPNNPPQRKRRWPHK